MNTDKLVTAEALAGALKMAIEGARNKPGLMKSAVPHMELIHKYVENIVTARDNGKRVIALVRKVGIADKFVISGGIGRNVGLLAKIEGMLEGVKVNLPQAPMIVGAVGAALFAFDRAKQKSPSTGGTVA